jgi:hypothetical protein
VTGTKSGWVAARQTMKELEYIRDMSPNPKGFTEGFRKEVANNMFIWSFTLELLKEIDVSWEIWYDSPILPKEIVWTGMQFQKALGLLWERIKFIKLGDHNEKAEPSQYTTRSEGNGSFIYLWGE